MKKRRTKTKTIIIIICALLTLGVVFVLVNNYCIRTTYSVYATDKIQDSINIVLLSDLHGVSFGAGNQNLVNVVSKQNPDVIVMAGDMFDERCNTEPVTNLIRGLKECCPNIYYSFGNHEERQSDAEKDRMAAAAAEAGAVVLDNTSVTLKIRETEIRIYGLRLPLYFYSGYDDAGELMYELKPEKIESYIGKPSDKLNVLIAHNPIYFESYAAWGADIVVSGHNHGGVVRLPFYGAVASPNGDRGHIHYDCGEYKSGNTTMFLSRGLGEWVGPVRAFNLPEVYVIRVQNTKNTIEG